MCTSIYTTTTDQKHMLARTMDFSYPLASQPIFIPRKYTWNLAAATQTIENKYGFIGTGKNLGGAYFVADGVNEMGLAVAELYLPGEAVYHEDPLAEQLNLAPHEFILWLLGNCRSVDDVAQRLAAIRLIDSPVPVLGFVTPLHWIITDKTGACVVIEPTSLTEPLQFKQNPVGVMTNTPKLEWHIENLRNYLNTQPMQFASTTFGTFTADPFSQGTGTSGLPGGYTPPERFVRAAFFKEHIESAKTETEGVHNAFEILSTVKIPKGIVQKSDQTDDYSQYISVMCNETSSFYYQDYNTNEISCVQLHDQLLASDQVVEFPISKTPIFKTF